MIPTFPPASPAPIEPLSDAGERVVDHGPESGFCELRVQVRGQRDLVALIGSAASISPGEHVESRGSFGQSSRRDRHQRNASMRQSWRLIRVFPGDLRRARAEDDLDPIETVGGLN
jgi:exodeoxyribonuclease V alpha subunit